MLFDYIHLHYTLISSCLHFLELHIFMVSVFADLLGAIGAAQIHHPLGHVQPTKSLILKGKPQEGIN